MRTKGILFSVIAGFILMNSGTSLADFTVLKKEQMYWMITTPSTKVLHEGQSISEFRFLSEGSMLYMLQFGLIHRLSIGFSYGGRHYLSNRSIVWNSSPGIIFKYSLCCETPTNPAVLLGINTQGWGEYKTNPATDEGRYFIKGLGLYAAAGKMMYWKPCIGRFAISGGINYNPLENADDGNIDLFFGFYKPLWRGWYFATDYLMGINDNYRNAYGGNNGYFNMMFGTYLSDTWALEFGALDLLVNHKTSSTETRFVRLIHVSR